MAVLLFNTASSFPNFDGSNALFPNSTGSWSRLQVGRNIPENIYVIPLTFKPMSNVTPDPGLGILALGYNLNKFGRGPLGDSTYHTSRL